MVEELRSSLKDDKQTDGSGEGRSIPPFMKGWRMK